MAVAVKDSREMVTQNRVPRFSTGVGMGTAYILGSLALVFYGIPAVWQVIFGELSSPLDHPISTALLAVVMAAAAAGLCYLAPAVMGGSAARGLRAGIFFGIVEVLAILLVASGVGWVLQSRVFHLAPDETSAAGGAITAAIGVALLVLAGFAQTRPGYEKWVAGVEEQGWFTVRAYKRSQGQRVRRGTILGILVLAGCGIYTLMEHKTLGMADWKVVLPFSGGYYVTLLPDASITLPLVLAALSLWLAYRVVNLPPFADFLIATEAELNKVSWTTRKRLIQDTVVVMVTVILLTVFLFVVDSVWGWTLTKVGVLQITPPEGKQTTEEQPW